MCVYFCEYVGSYLCVFLPVSSSLSSLIDQPNVPDTPAENIQKMRMMENEGPSLAAMTKITRHLWQKAATAAFAGTKTTVGVDGKSQVLFGKGYSR